MALWCTVLLYTYLFTYRLIRQGRPQPAMFPLFVEHKLVSTSAALLKDLSKINNSFNRRVHLCVAPRFFALCLLYMSLHSVMKHLILGVPGMHHVFTIQHPRRMRRS